MELQTWSTIVPDAGHLPGGVWTTVAVANLVATVLTWSGAADAAGW
ncbi:hypothetical protein [Actinoplanes subtropicus]|nr:hypothetical protein [Actinoplanes subtropicus]